jgi:hypothetical protein
MQICTDEVPPHVKPPGGTDFETPWDDGRAAILSSEGRAVTDEAAERMKQKETNVKDSYELDSVGQTASLSDSATSPRPSQSPLKSLNTDLAMRLESRL